MRSTSPTNIHYCVGLVSKYNCLLFTLHLRCSAQDYKFIHRVDNRLDSGYISEAKLLRLIFQGHSRVNKMRLCLLLSYNVDVVYEMSWGTVPHNMHQTQSQVQYNIAPVPQVASDSSFHFLTLSRYNNQDKYTCMYNAYVKLHSSSYRMVQQSRQIYLYVQFICKIYTSI